MSFMSIAPRPQTQPSAISPENGSCRQSGGVGGDDVEVAVDEEGGAFGVPAGDSGYQAGALGVRFEDHGLEADVGEESGDVLGRLALARTGVVAVVRGVDPDQVTADVHDLVLRAHIVRCHRPMVAPGPAVRLPRLPGPGLGLRLRPFGLLR